MALRILLVALALICAGAGALGLRSNARCEQAQRSARSAPTVALPRIARDIGDRCGDPRDAVVGAVVVGSRGEREVAVSIARRVAAQHPQDYIGWLAVYRLGGDQRALARAHRLNPRAVPAPSR